MSAASTAHVADIVILGFLALAALIGFISGFTRLVLGILAWIGALALATLSVPLFAPFVQKYVPHPLAANIIAGSITFIITLSIFIYVSRTIGSAVKSSALGGLDRTLGLVFGAFMGAVMFSALFNFAQRVIAPEKYNDLMLHAKAAPYLKQGADFTRHLFIKMAQEWVPGLTIAETPQLSEPSNQDIADSLSAPSPKASASEKTAGYEGIERETLEKLIEQEAESSEDVSLEEKSTGTEPALSSPSSPTKAPALSPSSGKGRAI